MVDLLLSIEVFILCSGDRVVIYCIIAESRFVSVRIDLEIFFKADDWIDLY